MDGPLKPIDNVSNTLLKPAGLSRTKTAIMKPEIVPSSSIIDEGFVDHTRAGAFKRAKTMVDAVKPKDLNFDVMDDPDYPAEAVNSNIIVEQIEVNGCVQKIVKKTYYMIDGTTKNVTRVEMA
jgi:hypothetical protein